MELPALGEFVDYPALLEPEKGYFICPCCHKSWRKEGSGYGFAKRGARKHVSSCYVRVLSENGLEMRQPYDMDNLGWEIIKSE